MRLICDDCDLHGCCATPCEAARDQLTANAIIDRMVQAGAGYDVSGQWHRASAVDPITELEEDDGLGCIRGVVFALAVCLASCSLWVFIASIIAKDWPVVVALMALAMLGISGEYLVAWYKRTEG